MEGFSSGKYNEFDPTIQDLLKRGTLQEVKEEMEDTDLLVQQLDKKLAGLSKEEETYRTTAGNGSGSSSFVERMETEERLEEVLARKKVVEGYVTKAKGRLLRLQTKYKELRANERSSSSSSSSSSTSSSDFSNERANPSSPPPPPGNGAYSSDTNTSTEKDIDDSWKREGFGTRGRGRGRGRKRASTTSTTNASRSSTATSSSNNYSSSSSSTTSNTTTNPNPPPSPPNPAPPSSQTKQASDKLRTNLTEWQTTPPHRRTSSQKNSMMEDKKRLRELQVEDEFEKLKKELGL